MKTKTKKRNALGACGTDINKRRLYEVEVHRIDYLTSWIRVKAKSDEEAKNAAEHRAELQADSEWHSEGRDLYAFDAEQLTEGGRHV